MNTNNKILTIFSGLIVLVLIVGAAFFYIKKPAGENNNGTATTTTQTGLQYKNTQYGFTFDLPDSWTGYSIVTSEWKGDTIDAQGQVHIGTITGPLIYIRHPAWQASAPRQDVPIMVFTIQEWNDMQVDKFHIGAAPINPSELGRNSKYVFGLPARYNFSYLTGYEEVDQLIQTHSLTTY